MILSRAVPPFALAAAVVAAAGCGSDGPKYVPVSGVVKVDGQPYKNAVVSFQPVGTKDSPAPGRGSSAVTDDQGRYSLLVDDGTAGAVVGKHRVRIQTKRDDPAAFYDPAVGNPDNAAAAPAAKKGGRVDPIPAEWYSDRGGKEFEVPPGGTDKADFSISSARTAKSAP